MNAPMMARMAIVNISGTRGIEGTSLVFHDQLDAAGLAGVSPPDIDRVTQWLKPPPLIMASIMALSCSCAVETVEHLSRQGSRHKTGHKERDESHHQ
jgi:hypothetical protein